MEKEVIFNEPLIPIKIYFVESSDVHIETNINFKIIYSLENEFNVKINHSNYPLKKNSFLFIGSYSSVEISSLSQSFTFLEFIVENTYIQNNFINFHYVDFIYYSLYSKKLEENNEIIIQHLFQILKSAVKKEELKLIKHFLTGLFFFIDEKIAYKNSISKKYLHNKSKIVKTIDFIEEHYGDENLNVDDIAAEVDFSYQYTLKFFKKNFSQGLIDYIKSLRVRKSLENLIYTNKSILEIAVENGFGNTKSYHKIFKEKMKMTPGTFRKQYLDKKINNSKNINLAINIIQTYLKELPNKRKYIEKEFIEIDINKIHKKPLNHYWKRIISIGKASDILKSNVQYQIKKLCSDITYEFARFDGIFNSDIFMTNKKSLDEVIYNFSELDNVLDFIIKNRLKPFININYKQIHLNNSVLVDPSNSIDSFCNLVECFLKHIIKRYGISEITTWYFEISYNYNFKNINQLNNHDYFFNFFEKTYITIKNINSNLKIGGPSSCIHNEWIWTKKFIEYINFKKIKLDFFSTTLYYSDKMKITSDFNSILRLNELKSLLNYNLEIMITEYNKILNYELVEVDECLKNTLILNDLLTNFGKVSSLGFAPLFEPNNYLLNGNGLFSLINIKKSLYNVFLLLNKLGNNYIQSGDSYFITSKNNCFQIFLYNMSSYSSVDKNFFINFINLKEGLYTITSYTLNSDNGSSYDAWIKMGSPSKITDEISVFLKSKSHVAINIKEAITKSDVKIEETITANSIIFFEIILND